MKYCLFIACLFLFACQPTSGNEPDPAPSLLSEEELLSTDDGKAKNPNQQSFLLPFSISDSLSLLPESEESPRALYTISSFEAASANEKLNTVINTSLGRAIAGEEAPMRITDLRRTILAFVKTRIKAYRQQDIDSTLLESMPSAYAIDHHFKSEIRHQTSKILTLATTHYYYTGGAHGNYYTVMDNFNLEEATEIVYTDLFRPEAKTSLTEALKSVSEFASEDIHPTENVGITAEGFVFNFPPYEIGSFADGEIEIVLPFALAKDYLTERGLALIEK